MTCILGARRTPLGRFLGGLSRVGAVRLGAMAIERVLADVPGAMERVDECIMGCVLQAGLGQNPARQAGLGAGLPDTLSAVTVNKVCGSGLEAVMQAARAIRAGDAELVVAGGMENMSRAPHFSHLRAGQKFGATELLDHMQHDGLTCPFEGWSMGHAAEWIASDRGVARAAQDAFAARSHQRAAAAEEAGHFTAERFPLTAEQAQRREGVMADEGVRPDSSAEALAALKPAFTSEGTVTAGNASQITDGAAALIVASEETAKELGVEPLARIVDQHTVGVPPREIFTAPQHGVEAILQRNGLAVEDVDLYEINEAFAAQVLANIEPLGIPSDRLNICGGAIALGHPIGASGARALVTLAHQLVRTGGRRGVVSLCLGGGNAVTMLIERE